MTLLFIVLTMFTRKAKLGMVSISIFMDKNLATALTAKQEIAPSKPRFLYMERQNMGFIKYDNNKVPDHFTLVAGVVCTSLGPAIVCSPS